jgi:hypothetical protein
MNGTTLNHSGLVISADEGFDYQSYSKTITNNQNRAQEILRPYVLSTSLVRNENVNGNIRKQKKIESERQIFYIMLSVWLSQQLIN